MILVTGGTGLVGSHLLYELSKKQNKVRAVYRKQSEFDNIRSVFRFLGDKELKLYNNIEWVEADILNISELEIAFENISKVYHCAALVSFNPSDFEKMIKTNVEGTANIVNLSLHFKVKKLCYVSSVATLTQSVDRIITEQNDWNPEVESSAYGISKNGGETEVWRGSQEGLDVVIVNPSVIVGYGFPNSGNGMMFKKIKKGFSYYPKGSTGWVYAEDVAKAMIILMESDIKNERFILNANNWTFKKMFTKIAYCYDKNPPNIEISNFILQVGWRIDAFLSFLCLKNRILTKSLVRSLSSSTIYDGSKITKKTDFAYTDMKIALQKITQK